MFYIFNSEGKCVSTIDRQPSQSDLDSRMESYVEDDTAYDVTKISLVDNKIIGE